MNNFPRPKAPVNPVLTWSMCIPVAGQTTSSIAQSRHRRYVTSGRSAIALALQHANIKESDKVLVPAYHCSSMVEPVLHFQAEAVFYKIHDNTEINLDDIKDKTDDNVRVLLVTHYFGFPQRMEKILQYCKENNIILIEDCAHTYFGTYNGKTIGSFGDYAIASIMKFFPVHDGGCLVSNRHNLNNIHLSSAGLGFNLKSLLNTIEQAFEFNRLKILKYTLGAFLKLKDRLWDSIKNRKGDMADKSMGPSASHGDFAFESEWIDKKMSLFSRLIVILASKSRIVSIRKRHYELYQSEFQNLPGLRFLHDALPANVVPYVFPVIVENPESVFPILKQAGVPIIRFGEFLWDGVDQGTCENSYFLSNNLFQFPCHQAISKKEILWITRSVQEALKHTHPKGEE